MGWKSVKEHYRIDHIVMVTGAGICIGSPYIHDLIVIGADGTLSKPHPYISSNAKLARYETEMGADPKLLRRLVEQADTFSAAHKVYTYRRGEIIECLCEELGWPNVTHDGQLMYENTFSADRDEVVRWALQSAEARVENVVERVNQCERDLARARDELAQAQLDLASLFTLPGNIDRIGG